MKEKNIHTKKLFEKYYETRDWNWYRDLVAECIRYGMPGKWLDLGAGLGLFVECAQRFGIDCIGLEGSEYAVSKAKERVPNMNISHHFLEDKLPFENNSISTIVCYQVIEHICQKTVRFMLAECYRILVENGIILIYSPSKYNRKERLEETHINLYSPSSLRKELRSAGFEVLATPNTPRSLFGPFKIAEYVTRGIYKLFPFDCLSATANCIAVKPK